MTKQSASVIKAQNASIIKDNVIQFITPVKDRALRNNVADSFLNLVDGGLSVENEAGYLIELSVEDPRAFVALFQVQLIALAAAAGVDLSGLMPKSAGSGNPFTGDVYFGGNKLINIGDITDNGNKTVLSASARILRDSFGDAVLDFSDQTLGLKLFVTGGAHYSAIKPTSPSNELFLLPNKSGSGGTIAMTSDIANAIADLGQYVGAFDASSGLIPTVGSGTGGDIEKGDTWKITVPGTITGVTPNESLSIGDVLVANIANPSSGSDFFAIQSNVDLATSTLQGIMKKYSTLAGNETDGAPDVATVNAALDVIKTFLPSTLPAIDGKQYRISITDQVVTNVEEKDAYATDIAVRTKLQAEGTSDWGATGIYVGTTSGAIVIGTDCYPGETFPGLGIVTALNFIYECFPDGWRRKEIYI